MPMDTVRTILDRLGATPVAGMSPNERHVVSVAGHEDLAIEKTAPARLSVGHRPTEGGPRRNPEVVFRTENDAWIPIEFTDRPAIHRYDATGVDVGPRLSQWNRRLRRLGFVASATSGRGN